MSDTSKLPIRYGALRRDSDEPSTNERRALWIETEVLLPESENTQRRLQDARDQPYSRGATPVAI